MSFTWSLNSSYGDVLIDAEGKLANIYGQQEVRQRIFIALRHEYEEYFLNVPGGVPWQELILGSKDLKMVEALLRRAVLQVPGVIGIQNVRTIFSPDSDPRNFYMEMRVEVEGQTGPSIEEISFSLED